MSQFYLYIVRCKDETLYTGISNNVVRRIAQHNAGKGAKYVRGRLPVRLVYQEKYSTHRKACQREIEIKQWSKSKKEELILGFFDDQKSYVN